MTAQRLFAALFAAWFVLLGIGAIRLGIDCFASSPAFGEDIRPGGVVLVIFGVGCLLAAMKGVKMNFFTKDGNNIDPRSTT